MTVSSEDRITQYNGSGSAGPFSIGFDILEKGDLKVTKTVSGTDTELTLDAVSSGYTVDGTLAEVTLTEVLNSGEQLTIERDLDLTQLVDYQPNSAFPAEVNEQALDRLTMIAQQIGLSADNAIKFKSTLPTNLVGLITEAPTDGAVLQWDGTTGDIIVGPTATDVANAQTNAATATAAAATASAAAATAEAAAASVNLPTLGAAHTVLHVNSGGTALEYGLLDGNNIDTSSTVTVSSLTATDFQASTSGGGVLKSNNGTTCATFGGGGGGNFSPVGITMTNTVTSILDEDDMSSDSASALATQRSIKAYVDANAGGGVLQAVTVTSNTEQSITTTIPLDTTIPQSTEGGEVFSQSFTPTSASSKIKISGVISANQSSAFLQSICLFIDSNTDAEQVQIFGGSGSGLTAGLSFCFILDAGSTSTRTYKIRIGMAGGTLYVNSNGTSNIFGTGKVTSAMTIEEIET